MASAATTAAVPKVDVRFGGHRFGHIFSADDEYVTHITVVKPYVEGSVAFTLVLSKFAIYKVLTGDKLGKRTPLGDVIFVDGGRRPVDIILTELNKSTSSKTYSSPIMTMPCIRQRAFVALDEDSAYDFVTVLGRQLRCFWQAHFESTIVPAPDVYQCHCVLGTFPEKTISETLLLVLSTARIYVYDIKSPPKKNDYSMVLKGNFSYRDIENVAFTSAGDRYTCTIIVQPQYRILLGSKNATTFVARSPLECALFLADLQRLYFGAVHSHLSPELFDQSLVNVSPSIPILSPEETIRNLENGRYLLKFGKFGDPHWRIFRLNSELKRMIWQSDKKKAESAYINLSSLKDMTVACKSPVLDKFKLGHLSHLFFSLKVEGGRGVDIICKNEEDLEMWICAIAFLTKIQPTQGKSLPLTPGRHHRAPLIDPLSPVSSPGASTTPRGGVVVSSAAAAK